jgi:hypothetical protein
MRPRRRRPSPEAFRLPRRNELPPLLLYVAASAVYVTIGVLHPTFLYSWFVACAFLLLAVWLLPAAIRRLLR